MGYSMEDVKRLREETDAPIMECKNALQEANGDLGRAREILREKGKAAAGKKAGRKTGAGVVAFSSTPDGRSIGGVVVESETDFVSKNPEFVRMAQEIAELVRDQGAPDGDPMDDPTLKEMAEAIVARFRENVRITRAVRLSAPDAVLTYLHHDRSKGAAVAVQGPAGEEVRQVAIQAVAFPPEALSKDELPQERVQQEIDTEMARAMNEGKPENIARNIAQGRVNKEYVKRVVLLEQPFYRDPNKSVSQHLAETSGQSKLTDYVYLAVGQGG